MTTDLIENVKDGVAVLTLNRPDRLNAMSRPMLDALLEALPRLAEDPAVGVVVLTGAGSRLLRGRRREGDGGGQRAGRADDGGEGPGSPEPHGDLPLAARDAEAHHRHGARPRRGRRSPLAMACDLRVASDTARLGTAFARVGYSGDFGGSYYLTQLVGTAKARELYFTADLLDAPQALALGLVNRVVPDARLEEETMALASRLARGPRVALRYMKRNMNAAETASLKEMLDLEAWHHTRTGMTEDHREAARAFVEKREPHFKGR